MVGEIDDVPLTQSFNSGMGVIHETFQPFREPVVAPRLLRIDAHTLLHDGPFTGIGHDEAMKIKIEAILHRRAIDLGNQSARLRESGPIEPYPVADGHELVRRLS